MSKPKRESPRKTNSQQVSLATGRLYIELQRLLTSFKFVLHKASSIVHDNEEREFYVHFCMDVGGINN